MRDAIDRARQHAPLARAPDAIEVDTSRLGEEETLERLERKARERISERARSGLDAPRKIE
jgi:cytidylate kinase